MLETFELARIVNMLVYFLLTVLLFYWAAKKFDHIKLGNILIAYWIFDTIYNAILVISGPIPFDALPYQLCTITMILSAIAIRQKSEKLYQITIYTWISALVSMVTPNKNGLMPLWDYHTVVYYMSHGVIPLMQIYMTRTFRFRLYKYSFVNTLTFMLLYSSTSWIINSITGTNFSFITRPEQENFILSSLGNGFTYSLKLFLIGVMVLITVELMIRYIFRIKFYPYHIFLFRFFSNRNKIY